MKLPNPNSQRGIELQQAHVELVMRVLGGERLGRYVVPAADPKEPA